MKEPQLVPEWMSSEEVSAALLLLENPYHLHLVPKGLERLSEEDWGGLFLAYQFLMLARQRESLH
jgi:hypothetical protein